MSEVTDWKAVGARIRERRTQLGMTQEQLGKRVGSSGNYVAQVENGLALSEKKLALYSAVLDMSLPLLRYNVATAVDVAALTDTARKEGRATALRELRGWVESQTAEQQQAAIQSAYRLSETELDRADAIAERAAPSAKKEAPKRTPRKRSDGKR